MTYSLFNRKYRVKNNCFSFPSVCHCNISLHTHTHRNAVKIAVESVNMRSKGMSVHLDTVIMNRWGYYEKTAVILN